MCFVKSLIHKKTEFESAFKPPHLQKSMVSEQESTSCCVVETKSVQKNDLYCLFSSLLMTNSIALAAMKEKVQEVIQDMQNADQQVKQLEEPVKQTLSYPSRLIEVDPLVKSVFGKKTYKYKLQVNGEMPNILYKQRNFNLQLILTDSKGQPVRNANLIPLCIGAMTTSAQWINENRQGQTLIKGRSQVELYKGKAQFLKVYLREVSRSYPDGKIVMVVYAKPSMMKYLSHSDLQEKINEEEIMPLLIKDVYVKAKKK